MPAVEIGTFCFSLCLVRLGRRLLLVHERKHGGGWYIPAGAVEPNETFAEAARRETLEEAGIEIDLEGILQIEHRVIDGGRARMRVVFVARPIDDRLPKRNPDEHSLEAAWFTFEELANVSLRGDEVPMLFDAVLRGTPVYPLSLLR